MRTLSLYRAATWLAGPLVPLWLARRARAGKEDPARLGERYGLPGAPRPPGRLIWLHGASVGESMMLRLLAERLLSLAPDAHVLMTTHTVTAAELLARTPPARTIHQFIPLDRVAYVRRFLDHWRPQLGVLAESELWPNLIGEAARMQAPLALVNARMTAQSVSGWARNPRTARALLDAFAWIGAADAHTADALTRLSGRQAPLIGNLKRAAPPLPADDDEAARVRAALAGRPVWLAASTHPGEDEIVLAAHQRITAQTTGDLSPLVIIAPRHPDRGPDIARLAREAGWSQVGVRSAGDRPSAQTQVYVADTLGEMGLWLNLSAVTFLGGSLNEGVGGHNPLEPARADSPLAIGPFTHNFADVMAELEAEGGVRRVGGARDLAETVQDGLAGRLGDQADAAHRVAARGAAVLDAVIAGLAPLLNERTDASA